jgi:protein DGCR14
LAESEKKHEQKYSYLYNEEDKSEKERAAQLALPSIEEQGALPEKKLNVDTWGYKNKNYIMYIPDGVPLTQEQEIELNKKKQEVVHPNTRLVINPFNEVQSKEAINELAKTQAKVLDGKIGVDGKELMQNDSPKIRGFGFVKSPSPCPGIDSTPLMTWGEIEGTPFRLDGATLPCRGPRGPLSKWRSRRGGNRSRWL